MGWEAKTAATIFGDYRHRLGSKAIAGEFALKGLLGELRRTKPRHILEIGPGIGCTTQALVKGLDRFVGRDAWTLTAVEVNDFCRGQLLQNLADDARRLEVVHDGDDLDDSQTYDFVLIDGPGSAHLYVDRLRPRAVVFVENLRREQRAELDDLLADRSCAKRSAWPVLTTEQMGGYHVFQLDAPAWERRSYAVRNVLHRRVGAGRLLLRRALRRLRLTVVLGWFQDRADRHRISAVEFADPEVMAEGVDP